MIDPRDDEKRRAAEAAIDEVRPGMLVGLGTGSTAAFAIPALARRIADGLAVETVATSLATEAAAKAAGIVVRDFAEVARVDIAIDGADEIDAAFRAIKGGGGAMLREKIVAAAAERMICVVDRAKLVGRLGATRALPIEVLPFARGTVSAAIVALGGTPVVRAARSDQGNLLIDCDFGAIADPQALAAMLDAVPGLLGHGLFLDEIDVLQVGDEPPRRRDR